MSLLVIYDVVVWGSLNQFEFIEMRDYEIMSISVSSWASIAIDPTTRATM